MARIQPMQPSGQAYPMMPQMPQQPNKGFLQNAKEFLVGAPGQMQYAPLLTPQQQGLQSQNIQNVLGMLQGGANAPSRFDFGPIEAQARRGFETQTIPSLAERFTSLGGGQRSSAFQGALGQAGSDLEGQLAAMRSGIGLQQQQMDRDYLLNLLRFALMPQFESQYIPATGGLLGNAAGAVGQGLGSLGGFGALKYLGFL